jgi:hypothetical protein
MTLFGKDKILDDYILVENGSDGILDMDNRSLIDNIHYPYPYNFEMISISIQI